MIHGFNDTMLIQTYQHHDVSKQELGYFTALCHLYELFEIVCILNAAFVFYCTSSCFHYSELVFFL